MLKLSTSLLAFVGVTQAATQACIVCEHIGFAADEEAALNALAVNGQTAGDNYCISGGDTHSDAYGESSLTYCVAQFFVYKAKDMAADTDVNIRNRA